MTIDILGEAYVKIADLLCSPDFADRVDRPHVKALAESIRDLALIHPPMVRQSDGKVAAGEDRIAAHCVLERDEVRVTLIGCSDEELEAIRAAENKHRRADVSADQLLAMVEDMTVTIGPLPDGFTVGPGEIQVVREPGRPKERRTEAIEAVADETGRSAEAVRKAVERAASKRAVASIEQWGTAQPEEWLAPIVAQRVALTNASDKIRAAMAELTRMQRKSPIDEDTSWRIHSELQAKASAIRMMRPACVCAWCKNRGDYVVECTACSGRGFLTEEQSAMVPEELKDPTRAMRGGTLILLYSAEDAVPLEPARGVIESYDLGACDERTAAAEADELADLFA